MQLGRDYMSIVNMAKTPRSLLNSNNLKWQIPLQGQMGSFDVYLFKLTGTAPQPRLVHCFSSPQPLCKVYLVIPSVPLLPSLLFLGAVWNPPVTSCLNFSVFEYSARKEAPWKRFKINFEEREEGGRKQVLITTFPGGAFFCLLMELLEKTE